LTDFTAFPDAAKRYIARIADVVECEMSIISTGYGREHAILQGTIF
jgi:adenylosuccinate synthase